MLAVAGAVAGAAVAGPVTAAAPAAKKKFVKKQINKAKTQLSNAFTNADALIAGRVAFASANALLAVPTLEVTGLTTSITAPAPGFLVITGTADFTSFSNSSTDDCWINVDGTDIAASLMHVENDPSVFAASTNCATHAVVPVNTGAHTVLLELEASAAGVNAFARTLSATYVPYDGTGARPTTFTLARAAKIAAGQSIREG
ncbi:MAG: hypothetical protein ACRDH1_02575 [Actinomycetota bacterium]